MFSFLFCTPFDLILMNIFFKLISTSLIISNVSNFVGDCNINKYALKSINQSINKSINVMVGKYFDFEKVRMVDCVIEVELKKDKARSIKKRLH